MLSGMPPAVVAHRGASAYLPEHTRAAYALAIEQGADGLECDVRLSRDGHLVCLHDRRIDRTSTGRGVVSALPLDRLAAHRYDRDGKAGRGPDHQSVRGFSALPEGGSPPPLAAPDLPDLPDLGLLRFTDLLGMVRDTERPVRLFVETKHPVRYRHLVERRLVADLSDHGLLAPGADGTAPVTVMSFSPSAVRRVRQYAPTLPTVLLMRSLAGRRRDGSLPPWADHAGPGIDLVRSDPDYVRRAASHGNDVYCWTVNEPSDIRLCADLGVHHIATDAPAATLRTLANHSSATVADAV
ncbi:glycerophosphoryl diester phosphodiesterase [Actinoalloteichus cyanogriseus DSM 43889]|uniref:Glycerophosphoryl diester phosphodiesterase n=2 Tax=Actinoalloteichus cyanogriseus TaxID=2893586 RepID=A0ABT1JK58_ACTCY|nr:glycerophosphoryl diester phosphodiesterase [Actinoalloteichus caeruleus DSM 43889]